MGEMPSEMVHPVESNLRQIVGARTEVGLHLIMVCDRRQTQAEVPAPTEWLSRSGHGPTDHEVADAS